MSSLLLVLLGLFLPTQLGLHFWPNSAFVYGLRVDYLSPTLYLTDLLLLAIFLFNFPKIISTFVSSSAKGRIHVMVGGVLILFNLFFSLNFSITLVSWLRLLLLLNLALFISRQSIPHLRLLLLSLASSTMVISFITLLQFFSQSSLGGLAFWLGERRFDITTPGIARIALPNIYDLKSNILLLRPYATFSHPNSLAGYLLVVLLLFFYLRPQKLFLKFSLLTTFIALLLTFSRSAYLALIFVFLLPRKFLMPASIIFFILLALVPFFPHLRSNIYDLRSISDRLFLASDAFKIIQDRPLFGVGLGAFTAAQGYFHLGLNNSFVFLQPVHHLFLLLLSETGLVGVGLIILLIKKTISIYDPRSKILDLVISAILLTGSLDHYWLTLPQNRLLLALCFGLFLNKHVHDQKHLL